MAGSAEHVSLASIGAAARAEVIARCRAWRMVVRVIFINPRVSACGMNARREITVACCAVAGIRRRIVRENCCAGAAVMWRLWLVVLSTVARAAEAAVSEIEGVGAMY